MGNVSAHPPMAGQSLSGRRSAPRTVLVVEDAAEIRAVVTAALRGAGYRVLEAGEFEQIPHILGTFDGDTLDVLLTDFVMPSMTGADVVAQVEAVGWTPRVVYMSGLSKDDLVALRLIGPRAGHLQKPFTTDRLLAAVRAALAV